jgi:pimeloyl-ACP methyl ester carboxylesterase
MTPSRIRFALRRNSRLAYRASGAWEERPAVFLHDLLFTQTAFSALAAPGLAVDLRGHGASASLANQWIAVTELADDLAAVLDAESIESAHLVGHGLGGAIAVEFARKHPNRARSLVLIEPNLPAVLDHDLDRGARSIRDELRASDRDAGEAAYKGLIDKALDGYLAPRFGPDWRDGAAKARSAAIRRSAGALAGMLPALDAYAPSRADLAQIATPTLVLIGPDASPINQLIAARLTALLPNAERAEFPLADRLNDPFGGESASLLDEVLETMNGAT